MKHLKLKTVAATVLTASVAMSGTAQADSVLAPLLASDIANGFVTVVSVKARGNGNPDSRFSGADITDLHYTYLKKGSTPASLQTDAACVHDNGSGTISSWDMLTHTVDPFFDFVAKTNPAEDNSQAYTPAGIVAGQAFYGMAVIDDVVNLDSGNEGNLSGDVNVFNVFTGTLLDYKLLNNHKSTASGNFSSGFTRKSSVDLSWNPTDRDFTFWLGVATGPAMTSSATTYSDSFVISQNIRNGNSDPKIPHNNAPNTSGGVYDNDERNFSGDTPVTITCMEAFTRNDFMNGSQEFFTRDGGWTRKSIIGADDTRGGIVYKVAVKLLSAITGSLHASFQPETSGHLALGNEHPNRPY